MQCSSGSPVGCNVPQPPCAQTAWLLGAGDAHDAESGDSEGGQLQAPAAGHAAPAAADAAAGSLSARTRPHEVRLMHWVQHHTPACVAYVLLAAHIVVQVEGLVAIGVALSWLSMWQLGSPFGAYLFADLMLVDILVAVLKLLLRAPRPIGVSEWGQPCLKGGPMYVPAAVCMRLAGLLLRQVPATMAWGGPAQVAPAMHNAVEACTISEVDYSLPSGHASSTAAILVALLNVEGLGSAWRLVFAALGTALVLLAGYSRVYFGFHFALDVLSGYALGAAASVLAFQTGLKAFYLCLSAWPVLGAGAMVLSIAAAAAVGALLLAPAHPSWQPRS